MVIKFTCKILQVGGKEKEPKENDTENSRKLQFRRKKGSFPVSPLPRFQNSVNIERQQSLATKRTVINRVMYHDKNLRK